MFSPPSEPFRPWIAAGGCPNILKTLNTDINPNLQKKPAGGLLSLVVIYPIYSVIKNRLQREHCCIPLGIP